jgi:uncharacterized protein YkwD
MSVKSGIAGAAALAIALVLLCGGRVAAASRCHGAARPPGAMVGYQLRGSILCLVNRLRDWHGLPRLRLNLDLRDSAVAHSRSMVRSGVFSHYGSDGSSVESRIAHSGYLLGASSYRVAEDIGAGKGRRGGSPLAIVRGWMRSPGHRQNILDPGLREFGAGMARGDPLGGGANAATYTLDFGVRRD